MFLPEDLLFKSGQLARVWLAANQHKKLTKAQVLQDKIDEDIQVIMRPEGAAGGPLALRLNGQLLLGVVRIYHRKAHYLHDDCNDALWKIKMAFRPGNIDLPTQTHIANPMSLTLPDMITDLDLLAPMPDPELLLSQTLGTSLGLGNTTLPNWGSSQLLSGSIEQVPMSVDLMDEDLGIDIGEDQDESAIFDEGTSVEVGRNASIERRVSDEFPTDMKDLPDEDLGIDIGEDETEVVPAPDFTMGEDIDVSMGDVTGLDLPVESAAGDVSVQPREQAESPPPMVADEDAAPVAEEVTEQATSLSELDQEQQQQEEGEESVHQARAKRRRVIAQDAETMMSLYQLKDQQINHDKILKPASFLPRDPLLMALMNMQKSGGFISSILGDGRSQDWAPELRGILSFDAASRSSQKRKRDSGVADLGSTEDEAGGESEKTPQLELGAEETSIAPIGFGVRGDSDTLAGSDDIVHLADEPAMPPFSEDNASPPPMDNFDDTTAPLIHPDEAGPVSLGTKHAVHLLRERFGAEAEADESVRQRSTIVFQTMLPESRTSRADATKMFFEILVLATKDAIKVEQPTTELGGPLRIRAKRGLWGQWAETAASGESSSQPPPAPRGVDVDMPAGTVLQGPPEVPVSA